MSFRLIFSMNAFSILLFFQLLLSCTSKHEPVQKKLIALEYAPNTHISTNYYIVSFNFEDGAYVSKDTLCNFKPLGVIEYETYSLYKNRYVISECGFIYDIRTKKILLNTDDKIIYRTGDSLIYYKYDYLKLGGYIYNLKTNTYNSIANTVLCNKNASYGKITLATSPDTKYGLKSIGATWKNPSKDLQLALYDSSNTLQTIVQMGGMGTYQHGGSSDAGTIPVYWLNNSTFIYAKYLSPEVNYRVNVEIHKVNLYTKADQTLCAIDTVKGTVGDAVFYRDELGNLLLEHGAQKYQFNNDLTQVHQILFENKGNNFEAEVGLYEKKYEIKHNTVSLGKFLCYAPDIKTTENYIAFDTDKGISVWNNYTSKWQLLSSPRNKNIIGWIE